MNRLIVSSSPHIKSSAATNRIMLDVIIAALPALVMGTVIFGMRALFVTAVTVIAAVLSEFLFNLAAKKAQTVGDLSAVVTGLLLALNLRADAPLWQCVVGSVFAIVVVKCLFGGLGCNFANMLCRLYRRRSNSRDDRRRCYRARFGRYPSCSA